MHEESDGGVHRETPGRRCGLGENGSRQIDVQWQRRLGRFAQRGEIFGEIPSEVHHFQSDCPRQRQPLLPLLYYGTT